jgi:hypothetical protein
MIPFGHQMQQWCISVCTAASKVRTSFPEFDDFDISGSNGMMEGYIFFIVDSMDIDNRLL